MKKSACTAVALVATTTFDLALAQTWCGKHYMPNQTVVPPGGQFQLPAHSEEPLVAFHCSPALRPFLNGDAKNATFIVDTYVTYRHVQNSFPISLPSSTPAHLGDVNVTISIGHSVLGQGTVALESTGNEISVDLSVLEVRKTPYDVTCSGTYQVDASSDGQHFSIPSSLLYLADTDGSVVKSDLRTGTLWVRRANGESKDFAPFVPQGFYVSMDAHLAKNLSLIDQLKADGFNTIHPIPPYDNATLFEQVLERTAEIGLYLVFDMRADYQNLTVVSQLVETYRSLPNLLLWETAHEPDGNSDPFDAARNAYDVIYSKDGYHPVSIVLNCQDYNFAPYARGADIILEDAYPVSINATFSRVWHAPCTPDFGHCGCDNCQGHIYDIKARVQTFKDRLAILGYHRTKAVWSAPQAFGDGAYWNQIPTGVQWAAMILASFNHGATGMVSFQYPTTTGNVTTIEGTSHALTAVLRETVQPFFVDPTAMRAKFDVRGVDVSVVYNGTAYLVLAVNLDRTEVHVPWSAVGLSNVTSNATSQIQRLFSVMQNTSVTGFNFRSGGVGIYTATPPE